MKTLRIFLLAAPLLLVSCHSANVSPVMPGSAGSLAHMTSPDIVQGGSGSQWIIADPFSCCVTTLTAGPNATMWYSDTVHNLVGRIDMSDAVTTFPLPSTIQTLFMTAGPDGNMWVTAYANRDPQAVVKVTPVGQMSVYHVPCATGVVNELTSGPDGNVWIGTAGPAVVRITPTGTTTCFAITGDADGGITTGSDGNVWFTERTSTGNLLGRVTPSGTVTEFPEIYGCDASLVGGGDGNLYSGCRQGLVRISTATGAEKLLAPVLCYSNLTVSGTGDKALLSYSVIPNHLRIRHLVSGKVDDNDLPSGQRFALSVAFGPDGNLWYFVINTGISIDVLRILTVNPMTMILPVGQSQTATASETNHSPSSLTAKSLNPKIATVVNGSSPGEFNVTGQGTGSTSVRVADHVHNYVDIAVTVH